MLQLLMLEDTQSRVDELKKRISRCRFAHADTNRKAIAALQQYRFDTFFMDFNLAKREDSKETAEWMVDNKVDISVGKVIIHSMDSKGASELNDILGWHFDVLIIPGVWDMVSINNGRLQLIL